MRNRKLQRQIKKYLSNGGSKEDIEIVKEKRLNRTSEYGGRNGSVVDETPWLAVKPGKRMIIKKNSNTSKGDHKTDNADQ